MIKGGWQQPLFIIPPRTYCYGQISFSVFDLKVVGSEPADIHDQCSGSVLQGADDCCRCCIGLRVAADIVDQNGIGLALISNDKVKQQLISMCRYFYAPQTAAKLGFINLLHLILPGSDVAII